MPSGTTATTVYVPGHRTLSSLKRDVLNYIQGTQSDNELNAVAQRAINNAIDKINSRTWNKITNNQQLTLVADQDTYSVASEVKEPMILMKENSSAKRTGRIHFKDLKTFYLEHYSATSSGTPEFYSIQYKQRKLILAVAPSSAYISQVPTLRLWYFRRIPHLVGDSEVLDVPPEFEAWLVYYAASHLAAMRGHQVLEWIDREARIAWQDLVRDDVNIQPDWSEAY